MTHAATAFLWGKLPAHGDFVSRGLASEARDSLDHWLAAGLAEARARLGEQFETCYDEAPPWRFRWQDEAGWTAGAMVPSVDQVGRRYPLLIGQSRLVAERTGTIAAAAEDAIYAAFETGADADGLVAATAALAPGDAELGEMPDGDGWWTLGGEYYLAAKLPAARPNGLWQAILERSEGATA